MHISAKALAYVATFVAGMAMVVLLQVVQVFPTPFSGVAENGWYIHPLYSFSTWVYIAVVALFIALAAVFTLYGRQKELGQ
jgi:ABC-type Na+ efflux pump permease subunit